MSEPSTQTNYLFENKYAIKYRSSLDKIDAGLEKDYLLSRVFPMMDFYSRSAAKNKRDYYVYSIFSIILNGVIPVVTLFGDGFGFSTIVKVIITTLSSISGILMALNTLKKPRENWIKHKSCLEKMHRTVNMFFMRTGEFDVEHGNLRRVLFDLIEGIVNEENEWTANLNMETSSEII